MSYILELIGLIELNDEIVEKDKEIERLNNDIKELLKENGNKEKVIIAQDNIIKEVREYIETKEKDDDNWVDYELLIEPIKIKEILDKENK